MLEEIYRIGITEQTHRCAEKLTQTFKAAGMPYTLVEKNGETIDITIPDPSGHTEKTLTLKTFNHLEDDKHVATSVNYSSGLWSHFLYCEKYPTKDIQDNFIDREAQYIIDAYRYKETQNFATNGKKNIGTDTAVTQDTLITTEKRRQIRNLLTAQGGA